MLANKIKYDQRKINITAKNFPICLITCVTIRKSCLLRIVYKGRKCRSAFCTILPDPNRHPFYFRIAYYRAAFLRCLPHNRPLLFDRFALFLLKTASRMSFYEDFQEFIQITCGGNAAAGCSEQYSSNGRMSRISAI